MYHLFIPGFFVILIYRYAIGKYPPYSGEYSDEMEKVRYNWVDWVKVIGIWLVTLGHGNLVSEEMQQFIYSFHMPLFFVLSGYLFKVLSIKDRVRKDFQTLIIPYLGINSICFMLWLMGGYLIKPEYHWSVEPVVKRLGAILLGIGYDTDFWIAVCTPLWFLIALFIVRYLCNIISSRHYFILCLTILVIGYVFVHFDVHLYFSINSAVMALPFFVVGIWMKKCLLRVHWLWSIVCLGILFFVNHYNGRVDMAIFHYGQSMLLYYIGGFAGTFFIFAIAQLLNRYSNRFVRVISEGTILIMGFNLLAIEAVGKLCGLFGLLPEVSPFVGVAISVLILLWFYPCILLSGKYLRCLIGKQKKFRL